MLNLRDYLFYEEPGITLYCGDARELLPEMSPFDAVLTDPPYGIGKAEWDNEFARWWLADAARLAPCLALMPGIWNLPKCPEAIGRLRYRWTLSAHLVNGMTRGAIGFGNWIPCVLYAADEPVEWCRRFAAWCRGCGISRRDLDAAAGTSDMGGWWLSELGWRASIPSPDQWAKLRAAFAPPDEFNAGVAAGLHLPETDCRDFTIQPGERVEHPSQKPMPIVRWFLARLPGTSVLDPFAGSGTTLRAAKEAGREAIGIEIEPKYCEIAVKRLRQEVLAL